MAFTEPENVDPEVILMQLMSAVGQGAGTLTVGYDAMNYLRTTYLGRIRARADRWAADRLLAFEWARAAGRQAASIAVREGMFEITAAHVQEGLATLAARSSRDGDCPFC